MDIKEKIDIIKQIENGLNYLHENDIFHGDLAFKNILYEIKDNKNIYKITDFGLSKILKAENIKCLYEEHGFIFELPCPPNLRSPAYFLNNKKIDTQDDLFSLSKLSFSLLINYNFDTHNELLNTVPFLHFFL